MDFEGAAQRLARDQSKLKGRRKVEMSAKAVREAEFRKKQQARRKLERDRQRQRDEALESYVRQCERSLGVKQLVTSAADTSVGGLQLQATSIYGEGDKIALPPSVLETLSQNLLSDDQQGQQPWTFRIGILNPDYTFPASPLLQTLHIGGGDDDNGDDDDDVDNDNNEENERSTEAYLDELKHKYLAYTHGTVVEFTQEEGHVGLPEPVARALLNTNKNVPVTRTKDVAVSADDSRSMEIENDDNEEKTPGHLAWGAFDVPACPVQISLVQLPKGKTATLKPTPEAVKAGFYSLKDIKLVLEQSLIRTRATLTVNDNIHTWHRGTKFDLTVTAVTPADFHAVSCINTDIEIDFAPQDNNATQQSSSSTAAHTLGRRLDDDVSLSPPPAPALDNRSISPKLPPEPPADSDSVVVVQIRADTGARGQRRFDISTATVIDLFAFARSVGVTGNFQLVTRFPRRVLRSSTITLQDAGIGTGQELFLVEKL